MYLSPLIKQAKYKNDCINNSRKDFYLYGKDNEAKIDIEEKSGFPIQEFIKIDTYRNYNHTN